MPRLYEQGAQIALERLGFGEASPGDAVAGDLEGDVAAAVGFEAGACAVELIAVELDDEAVSLPHGVDLVAGDELVGLGQREAGGVEEGEEGDLEL
jgi:hypothetical protein